MAFTVDITPKTPTGGVMDEIQKKKMTEEGKDWKTEDPR